MAMAWVRPEDGIMIATLLLTVLLAIGSAVVVATSITTTAIRLYVMSLMMPAVSMIKQVKQNIKMRIRAKIQAKVQAVKRTRICIFMARVWRFMTQVWRFLQTTLLKIGRLILLILVAIEDRTRLFSNLLAKYIKMHKRLMISYRLMKFKWFVARMRFEIQLGVFYYKRRVDYVVFKVRVRDNLQGLWILYLKVKLQVGLAYWFVVIVCYEVVSKLLLVCHVLLLAQRIVRLQILLVARPMVRSVWIMIQLFVLRMLRMIVIEVNRTLRRMWMRE